jgi:hypothetical protein
MAEATLLVMGDISRLTGIGAALAGLRNAFAMGKMLPSWLGETETCA